MQLEKLLIRNFRNYRETKIEFSPYINLLIGQNAQGKTNLLEAIYLLAFGRSFRSNNEQDLIRYGCDGFRVEGVFSSRNGVKSTLEYAFGPAGKAILQNGVALKRAQDLFGRVNVVLFSPDDLQLLKGGPEHRRTYLDLYLAQTEPRFRRAFHSYQRALFQRNELLRRIREKETDREELLVWNETFLARALEVIGWRLQAMRDLAPSIVSYHARLAGGKEEIALSYMFGGKVPLAEEAQAAELLGRELVSREKEEIIRGLTLTGPHRDDIAIGFRAGRALRSFASQGQQRTAALAMKLAAVDYLTDRLGEPPIVLLDDVLSEFDEERKMALFRTLLTTVQTLITSTEKKDFGGVLAAARLFLVEDGQIEEERQ
ncbi:MAG: DNA replication/repair protein RecF [Firmicutes bacterium]|nr:DNA replication/repair protein RecF [Bacillota bacterium]